MMMVIKSGLYCYSGCKQASITPSVSSSFSNVCAGQRAVLPRSQVPSSYPWTAMFEIVLALRHRHH